MEAGARGLEQVHPCPYLFGGEVGAGVRRTGTFGAGSHCLEAAERVLCAPAMCADVVNGELLPPLSSAPFSVLYNIILRWRRPPPPPLPSLVHEAGREGGSRKVGCFFLVFLSLKTRWKTGSVVPNPRRDEPCKTSVSLHVLGLVPIIDHVLKKRKKEKKDAPGG